MSDTKTPYVTPKELIGTEVPGQGPHCPKCSGLKWINTANPDALKCATPNCSYVFWVRNEPPPAPSVGQAAADAIAEAHRMRAAARAKRDRVRALVFALIASPASALDADRAADIYLPTELVERATEIDNLIERIE